MPARRDFSHTCALSYAGLRRFCLFGVVIATITLTGCSGFFFKTTSASTGGSTSTTATNYAFVANTGANTVTGLGISSAGVLAPLSGSPISFGVTPTAMAVSHNNGFLWVGTATQIFGFSISSAGAIAKLNNGNALASATAPVDMQTSPDGKWLIVLDGNGVQIELLQINSDGTLTNTGGGAVFTPNGASIPKALRINAAGTTIAAALGTAGEQIFSFNTSTGAFTALGANQPPAPLTSDNAIAWDSTGTYLYIARSGSAQGLVVETLAANGTLTPTTSSVYPTGSQPYAVVLDNTGTNVYVANRADGTISTYSIGTGAALTAVAGSPFTAGAGVTALAADSTGKWILAANVTGPPDLSLFGFDATTPGKLNVVSSTTTGTNASLLVLSH